MSLSIRSSAFPPNGSIPARHTCDGEDLSPPLEWSGVPKEAKSLALVVDDPDAPDPKAPQRTWVHWVVYDLPPDARGLPEGVAPKDLPKGAWVGTNDWKKAAYGGPCPPIGRHRYFHKLYALDTVLGLPDATKRDLERAMEGHVLAKAEVVGTYQRPGR
jgi:Raf kinase inhibitor-like YbhB/YbcL family protein